MPLVHLGEDPHTDNQTCLTIFISISGHPEQDTYNTIREPLSEPLTILLLEGKLHEVKT